MADVAVAYQLSTPAGVINFNDGASDQYYITEVTGLSMPEIRAPVDNVPFGDGALVHSFWKGPLRPVVEGLMLIQSTRVQSGIQQIRNEMEEDLVIALESIIRADGTFSFTPLGLANRTYTVRCEQRLEMRHTDNYYSYYFTFGLIAGDPNWSGSS